VKGGSYRILVLILTLQALCFGENQDCLDLFRRAADISDIRNSAVAPFELKARLQVFGDQPNDADYRLTWLSADHWREEIRSGNKVFIRIGDGDLVWLNQDRDAIADVQRRFRALVIPLTLQIRTDAKVGKIQEKEWNGSQVQCVQVTAGMLGVEQFCFDPASGVLLGYEWNNHKTEYSGFQNTSGKMFPRTVRGFEEGKLQSEITVQELATGLNGMIFTPGKDFESRTGCEFPHMFQVTYAPDPEYPARLRTSRMQQVQIEALVNETGTVMNMKITKSAGELDQYALKALQQWRFKPATCGTTPVSYELHTEVNFPAR